MLNMHDSISTSEEEKKMKQLCQIFFVKYMYISFIIDCSNKKTNAYIDIQRDCLKSSIDNCIIC